MPLFSSRVFPHRKSFLCLFAIVPVCALLASCAARRPAADYRVVRYGELHYVYPPSLEASGSGPASEATVEIPVAGGRAAERGCAVSEDGVQVASQKLGASNKQAASRKHADSKTSAATETSRDTAPLPGNGDSGAADGTPSGSPQLLVANLRLASAADGAFEPAVEDSVSPKLRSAFETLAAADCFEARSVRAVTRQVIENLPLRFNELLPHYYSYFRGGSSIDLSSGSRLKVQEAVFDEAARAAALQDGSSSPLAGYVGTVTAYYDAVETNGGSVALGLASIESDVPEDFPHGTRGTISPALSTLTARYLRLVFLGWLVDGDTERKAVLLASEGSNELERMRAAVLENPSGLCAAAAPGHSAQCFDFSGRTSTEVEVRVRVNGEERYVLLGTSLKTVAPAEAAVDGAVLARVKLRRRYDGQLVSVHLPAEDFGALEIPLLAGDEVAW